MAGGAGGPWGLFLALFAPEGWPTSVAPEYGRYQLWDTIQQVTFFVNTVISQQAVMKFHGVGDPTKTAAEATLLSMSRSMLASICALLIAVPCMLNAYKEAPRPFRLLAEMLNATGHFIEIMAAVFTQIVIFLYIGPIACTLAGTMSGAVRSVILQHFARGGQLPPGKQPDYGDISLKENNQDKGGKIFGLTVGCLLLFYIGVGQGAAAEQASLRRGVILFGVLTVLHIFGNIMAVLQLRFPPPSKQEVAKEEVLEKQQASSEASYKWCSMFVPKGYPKTVMPTYTAFQVWSVAKSMTGYPKSVVTQMIFWANVYGVGNSGSTPLDAVLIDIYMMWVDCLIGLTAGLPFVTQAFNYRQKKWFLGSMFIGWLAETLQLVASLTPKPWFFAVVFVSRSMQAFAGTSGSRINGAIGPAFMRLECVERKEIELIHINVAGGNQTKAANLPMGGLCILFLSLMVRTGWQPSMTCNLIAYAVLQLFSLSCSYRMSRNLPPLPGIDDDAAVSLGQPLLSPVESANLIEKIERVESETRDMEAEIYNTYSGPASEGQPGLRRLLSRHNSGGV